MPQERTNERQAGAAAGELAGKAVAQVVNPQATDAGGFAEAAPGFLISTTWPLLPWLGNTNSPNVRRLAVWC